MGALVTLPEVVTPVMGTVRRDIPETGTRTPGRDVRDDQRRVMGSADSHIIGPAAASFRCGCGALGGRVKLAEPDRA
jgi:hypothetical protein